MRIVPRLTVSKKEFLRRMKQIKGEYVTIVFDSPPDGCGYGEYYLESKEGVV